MAHNFYSSGKFAIIAGLIVCTSLSGCNKLGYGDPRTAPKGNAMMGAKRVPYLNSIELKNQQDALAEESSIKGRKSNGSNEIKQSFVPLAPAEPLNTNLPPMHYNHEEDRNHNIPPRQLSKNYSYTPYVNVPEVNHHANVAQPAQYGMQYSHQDAKLSAPYAPAYQFSENSYYAPAPSFINDNHIYEKPIPHTDYYTQDIQKTPISYTPAISHWNAQAAPVLNVTSNNLPPSYRAVVPNNYNNANNTPYSHYKESLDTPNNLFSSLTSSYDSVQYGDTLQNNVAHNQSKHNLYSNYSNVNNISPASRNGFSRNMQGSVNKVSSIRYLNETSSRGPLEVPPMLSGEMRMPIPNDPSNIYYGEGGYQ